MTNAITKPGLSGLFAKPDAPNRNTTHRLGVFLHWCEDTRNDWTTANLTEYRDYLLHTRNLAPITVRNHLATVRQRYRELLEDNTFQVYLETLAAIECRQDGYEDNPANIQAMVNRARLTVMNNIVPAKARVKVVKSQDKPDSAHVRLTEDQQDIMIELPFNVYPDAPRAFRDSALIALMLCTGLREAEVAQLEIPDLYQTFNNEPAVHVRMGKGAKERMIPYGALIWSLKYYVEGWLDASEIASGAVFRAFYKGGGVRPYAISVSAIQDIIKSYTIDGITVRPHDLRRTYARTQYDRGMSIEALSQNLGHEDTRTTMRYVGALSGDDRRGR